MKAFLSFFLTAGLLLATAAPGNADAKGDEAGTRYFNRQKATDTSATAVMTLVDKSGKKKVRELAMYTKEAANGSFRFVEFQKPAEVAGTKLLITPLPGGETEQRLYLPILKKVRKIAPSDKSGEFVNSDFFYYDMEDKRQEDYSFVYLSGGESLDIPGAEGMKFDKVEVTPKSKFVPYAKSYFWISQSNANVYKIEAFDKKDGTLLKTITFTKFDSQKGVMTPVVYQATNHKKGTSTTIVFNNLKVNSGLADSFFSIQNLEQ